MNEDPASDHAAIFEEVALLVVLGWVIFIYGVTCMAQIDP